MDGNAESLFVGVRKNSDVARSKKALPSFCRGAAPRHGVEGTAPVLPAHRTHCMWERTHWERTCPET